MKTRKDNLTIALTVLYFKEKEACSAYISKINANCERQTIILMIPNEEKEGWHYLSVKKLGALLRRITLKHAKDITDFEKKKNVTIDKQRAKITRSCSKMLHF